MTQSENDSSPITPGLDTLEGLRRVRDDIPLRVWLVASVSFWERASFWGLTAPWRKNNLISWLPHVLISVYRKLHAAPALPNP